MSLSASELRSLLQSLRGRRLKTPGRAGARRSRRSLSSDERDRVLQKTNNRCHLCGGSITSGESWQADHVLANSAGGPHSVANYLAAHALCNNYRWDYLPEEFQLILKLGVWARTKIERGGTLGVKLATGFASHEHQRERRLEVSPRRAAGRPTRG
jgi:hypothetical protein